MDAGCGDIMDAVRLRHPGRRPSGAVSKSTTRITHWGSCDNHDFYLEYLTCRGDIGGGGQENFSPGAPDRRRCDRAEGFIAHRMGVPSFPVGMTPGSGSFAFASYCSPLQKRHGAVSHVLHAEWGRRRIASTPPSPSALPHEPCSVCPLMALWGICRLFGCLLSS
jgi:hypothetical protein